MEALSLNATVAPLQPSARFFTEMINPDCAPLVVDERALVIQSHLEAQSDRFKLRDSPPLSPNRAFARSSRKPRRSRFGEAKGNPLRHQPSVLVVDDVADVAEMIALLLKHAGYKVSTADSATAALQLARERAFDLIISDIGMPEMNGYQLAEALRALGVYQNIPIIAVTGYSEYDDRGRAIQAGFSAHLTKPIDPVQLLDLMNQLLG
jgi:CheY-like chemotaxis protein